MCRRVSHVGFSITIANIYRCAAPRNHYAILFTISNGRSSLRVSCAHAHQMYARMCAPLNTGVYLYSTICVLAVSVSHASLIVPHACAISSVYVCIHLCVPNGADFSYITSGGPHRSTHTRTREPRALERVGV